MKYQSKDDRIKIYKKLKIKDQLLRDILFNKYKQMTRRCDGTDDKYGHYTGLRCLTLAEWVDFCNLTILSKNSPTSIGGEMNYCY
jgi:hypothetical protein